MFNWLLLFWWFVSVIAFISFLLLSFAFRDFSFLLLAQSFGTLLGLVLAMYFLTKHYNPQPTVLLVTQDKETGKTTAWYKYSNEDDNEEFN